METTLEPKEKIDEISEREKIYQILAETEGYKKLTTRQQQMIRQSIYIQQRAQRTTDPASTEAIITPTSHVVERVQILPEDHLRHLYEIGDGGDPEERKYRHSQNHIANWYCHAAIANLENERGLIAEEPGQLPPDFFIGNYRKVNDEIDIEIAIEGNKFPSIVFVGATEDMHDDFNTKHTFLALGKNEDGKVIVWDKEGDTYPYRVTNLDKICEEYKPNDYFWGVRSLKPVIREVRESLEVQRVQE